MSQSINFSSLGLNEALLRSLQENNITHPSEIQAKAIPFLLNNTQNLVGIAQTGTGKTAAFGLPILQQIDPKLQQTQALVLVPTRELGQQVAKDLFVFSRYIVRIHTEAVYGGKKIEEQIAKLQTPKHIIVATPGRLLDLLGRKAIDLSHLKFLVLDEADEMLNMGFKPDIDRIIKACYPKVRKLLFTSTLPADIKQMVKQYLGSEVHEISIKPQELVNKNITHNYIAYQYGYKLDYLKAYLLQRLSDSGIIFCRTQAAVKLLGQQLAGFKISVGTLFGDLSQYERDKVMNAFKAKRIQILIATDIAARGLDVKDLNYVIHFHLPETMAQYTNRSGRTARAGHHGASVCLLQEDELEERHEFEEALNIKFEPIWMEVNIEKPEPEPITMSINIGTRHALTEESFKEFIIFNSGVKAEAIDEIHLSMAHSTFVVDKRYEEQLLNNIHHKKFFHQRITMERIENSEEV